MKTYSSNEELFAEINLLIGHLAAAGLDTAAQDLRTGLSSLNGLTDGWALLMQSIERVAKQCSVAMDARRAGELHAMLAVVAKVVDR